MKETGILETCKAQIQLRSMLDQQTYAISKLLKPSHNPCNPPSQHCCICL